MNKTVKTFGILSLVLIGGGAILKSLHLPGAGISLALGTVFTFHLYLLFALIQGIKEGQGALNVITQFVVAIAFSVSSLGGLFTAQYYPGAQVLSLSGLALLVPAAILAWVNAREQAGGSMLRAFPFIILLLVLLSFRIAYSPSSHSDLTGFRRQAQEFERLDREWEGMNGYLLERLEGKKKDLAQKIGQRSKELCSYIDTLQMKLIEAAYGKKISREKLGSVFRHLGGGYQVPSRELGLVNPEEPEKGPWTAHELKERMKGFREEVHGLLKEKGVQVSAKRLAQMVYGKSYFEGDPDSVSPAESTWEGHHFYHDGMAQVMGTLSAMKNRTRASAAEVIAALEKES